MKAEKVTAPVAWHGEGPFWDRAAQRLLIMDMLAGTIVDLTSFDDPRRIEVGSAVSAVVRARSRGGYIVATEHGFSLFDADFVLERRLADAVSDPAIRLNEGGCDPLRRFFCGSMAYDETPGAASLYRVEADGSISTVLTDLTISNGLQWSLDGAVAYYIDTATRRVDVFDVDTGDGTLHDRRPWIGFGDDVDGSPDGMTIDAEGGLWVAFWGGGAVRRYDTGGALSQVVEVPGVTHTSAAAFGGPDLDTLYITSSRQHLPDHAEPDAGSVFAVVPGVRGTALPEYAG